MWLEARSHWSLSSGAPPWRDTPPPNFWQQLRLRVPVTLGLQGDWLSVTLWHNQSVDIAFIDSSQESLLLFDDLVLSLSLPFFFCFPVSFLLFPPLTTSIPRQVNMTMPSNISPPPNTQSVFCICSFFVLLKNKKKKMLAQTRTIASIDPGHNHRHHKTFPLLSSFCFGDGSLRIWGSVNLEGLMNISYRVWYFATMNNAASV